MYALVCAISIRIPQPYWHKRYTHPLTNHITYIPDNQLYGPHVGSMNFAIWDVENKWDSFIATVIIAGNIRFCLRVALEMDDYLDGKVE